MQKIGKMRCLGGFLGILCFVFVAASKVKIVKEFQPEICLRKTENGDRMSWSYDKVLINGEKFLAVEDSGYLGSGKLILGIEQGMLGMCVGEKRTLTIPPELAYGEDGAKATATQPAIPPKSTVIMTVELKDIFRPSVDPDPRLKEIEITDHRIPGDCKHRSSEGDKIQWKYDGKLLNGSRFDKGTFTAVLGSSQVIEGVDVAMRGLCVGDKRKMVIPSHLAYGDRGVEGTIPGGATIVFDVELLSIDPPRGEL